MKLKKKLNLKNWIVLIELKNSIKKKFNWKKIQFKKFNFEIKKKLNKKNSIKEIQFKTIQFKQFNFEIEKKLN